ncbi:Hpt domain-containing protein [Mangrovibacterium diazotrophicum]|uniref:Hpt domain-containing protein n=1 Tax=Mangrovibacterium diazotrophicum TaxID=1261403 RepID=UPI000E76FF1C|nr:Hpt domain-containing protein [Mangrovibacterium diazotrophicum]
MQYSIDQLLAFAGPEKSDQAKLLKMFVESAEQNASSFKQQLDANNRNEACEIAHKMLTTFRQIQATKITTLLVPLERVGDPEISDSRFFEFGRLAHAEIKTVLEHIKQHHL